MHDTNRISYLDHASTTPMDPSALEAMTSWLANSRGNPSGSHRMSRAALTAVDEAREEMASLLGCEPGEVIYTSGGTESDNLAVKGVGARLGGRILCSAIEHHAVLAPSVANGAEQINVDRAGSLDLDHLEHLLDGTVRFVSVMLANNEVGTVQPLAEIASIVRASSPNAYLHTDAVHAASWLDIPVATHDIDLVSLSAHKFGGPPGMGILVARSGVPLSPIMEGGSQERGRRPGSIDVPGIVATTAAMRSVVSQLSDQSRRVGQLRDRLESAISSVEGVTVTVDKRAQLPGGSVGRGPEKVAGSCHVMVEGVEQEELLFLLDAQGVCASAGSSCASGAMELSHVLVAMGIEAPLARGAVRFSLGYTTTREEIDHAVEVFSQSVHDLRK